MSPRKINAYALGELGFILAVNSFDMYIVYFLTDVVMIAPLIMSIILMISRTGDFISVPLTGILIEKANLKSGKLRPWLLICPPLMLVVIMACFFNAAMPLSVRSVIIIVAYTLYGFIKNTLYTAYLALPTTMTKSSQDRINLSVRRSQFNATAKILQSLTAMPLVLALGRNSEAAGYFGMMTTMAVCLLVLFLITYATSKEDPEILNNYEAEGRATVKEMVAQVGQNRNLLSLTVADFGRWMHLFFLYSLAMYYFKYIARDIAQITLFFTSINIMLLLGTLLGQFLARRFETRIIYNLGILILGGLTMLAFFFSGNTLAFTLLLAGSNIGFGLSNCVIISMVNDSAVFGEWKTRKNVGAFVMTFYSVAIILASVLSSPIIGGGLEFIGYEANAEIVVSRVSTGICVLITIVPGVVVFACGLVGLWGFRLTKNEVNAMQKEIDERH